MFHRCSRSGRSFGFAPCRKAWYMNSAWMCVSLVSIGRADITAKWQLSVILAACLISSIS